MAESKNTMMPKISTLASSRKCCTTVDGSVSAVRTQRTTASSKAEAALLIKKRCSSAIARYPKAKSDAAKISAIETSNKLRLFLCTPLPEKVNGQKNYTPGAEQIGLE